MNDNEILNVPQAAAPAPDAPDASFVPPAPTSTPNPTVVDGDPDRVDLKGRPLDPVPARVPWLEVGIFVAVAVVLGWLVCLPLWQSGDGLKNTVLVQLCGQALMFTPLLAAVIAIVVQRRRAKEPLAGIARYLGLWPLRPFGRVIGITVLSIIGTYALVTVSYLLGAAFGWVDVDLFGLSGFRAQSALIPGADSLPLGLAVLIYLALIVLGSLITAIFAFGEEVGWRGWLLTSLRPMGTWPALLVIGLIWGLWHAPLILLGYNFGRPDITGLGFMVGGCIMLSILFGWLRIRTGSLWPAVLAHGSLNGSSALLLGLLIDAEAPMPDMALVAVLGVSGWIVSAAIIAVLLLTGQFRRSPELAPPIRKREPEVGVQSGDPAPVEHNGPLPVSDDQS